jgi:hypothetical protein
MYSPIGMRSKSFLFALLAFTSWACSSSSGGSAEAAGAAGASTVTASGSAGTSASSRGGASSSVGGAGATSSDSGAAATLGGGPAVDYGAAKPPDAAWANVTDNLAGMQSECGNMGGVYSNPYIDMLIVGVARQGLWASTDGAVSYHQIGTGGDQILNRLSEVLWDPASTNTFWTSGIYGWESPFTDGVFLTSDNGVSFKGYAALAMIQSHNDSISVDFSDPARKTMLSGGHEQTQILFRSTDAGDTWTDIGPSLPATLGFCTTTLVLDDKTFLVGCAASYSGKAGAILRSTDGGGTWLQVNDKGVSGQPLRAADGSIYWAGEGGGVYKSTDGGQHFASVADAATSGGVRPIELPGGRIVSSAQKTLQGSVDGGATWQAIGPALPWNPVGIAYSPFRRAFYAWYFDCGTTVPADSIQRSGYDFQQ